LNLWNAHVAAELEAQRATKRTFGRKGYLRAERDFSLVRNKIGRDVVAGKGCRHFGGSPHRGEGKHQKSEAETGETVWNTYEGERDDKADITMHFRNSQIA
jgi:hypothetical protein